MGNTRLGAIKLNSTRDLDLLPLQCQYRIISGQRQSNRKGLVWVGSPVIDEGVSLPTCKHCRNNALECDGPLNILRGLRVRDSGMISISMKKNRGREEPLSPTAF